MKISPQIKKSSQASRKPKVSFPITVAIVTYNHGSKLKKCLDSIAKQTYQYIDLVIVDDFSCDFDQREVENYIQTLNSTSIQSLTVESFSEHQGATSAYRRALEIAKGDYILFLGGDDFLAGKNVITKAANALLDGKADILQTKAQLLRDSEEIIIPSQQCIDLVNENKLFDLTRVTIFHPFSQILCIQSAFFRVDTLLKADAFTGNYQFSVDWPLYLKLLFDQNNRFLYLDLLSTHMNDGGAYRVNSVGNLYIKKGYLTEAKRAILEYAVESRPSISQEEALMFLTAANSYEAYSTRVYDWYYYSIGDKLAWRMKNKNLFLAHKACYPNFGNIRLPLKKILAAVVIVFFLLAVVSILSFKWNFLHTCNSKYLLFILLGVWAVGIYRQKKISGQYFPNFNYGKLAAILCAFTGAILIVKKIATVSIPFVLLIILALLSLMAVCAIGYRVIYKLYCRYARRNYGKE